MILQAQLGGEWGVYYECLFNQHACSADRRLPVGPPYRQPGPRHRRRGVFGCRGPVGSVVHRGRRSICRPPHSAELAPSSRGVRVRRRAWARIDAAHRQHAAPGVFPRGGVHRRRQPCAGRRPCDLRGPSDRAHRSACVDRSRTQSSAATCASGRGRESARAASCSTT